MQTSYTVHGMNDKDGFDEISLRLLDELSREATLSQRALADRLGIALGLVNAYIKRLCKKGYLKVKFLPRNRIKYILTPRGFSEKTKLAYKFMQYSLLYFKDVRARIEAIYQRMVQEGVHTVLLWGDGELAELCYISTRGYPLRIVGAVGREHSEHGFFDRPVYTVEDISDIACDAILVASLDETAVKKLSDMAIAPEKIYYLGHEKPQMT